MRMIGFGVFCAAFLALSGPVLATSQGPLQPKHRPRLTLCAETLRGIAEQTHAKVSSCVVKRGAVLVQSTYYQNASKVGGTALAAYPEATVRFGVFNNVEAFVDVPSDVAKSGLRGNGVFYVTHPGLGLKAQLHHTDTAAYSVLVESHPPLDTMAHLSLLPQGLLTFDGQWSLSRRTIVGAQAGAMAFRQREVPHAQQTAALFGVSATTLLTRRTSATLQLRSISVAAIHSSAQSSGTLGITQKVGEQILFRIETGSAFNAAGHSKAHYFGFGFTFR